VNLAGGSDNTFVYAALPSSVVLEANKTYYLVSSETENGDTWYNLTQNVTVSGGLSAISTVWRYPGANYTRYGGGGLSFGPVGLKGKSSGGSTGRWVLAELLGLVSVERRACFAGSCGPLPDLVAAIAEVLPFDDA
jgi:hypothetical protein